MRKQLYRNYAESMLHAFDIHNFNEYFNAHSIILLQELQL